MNLAVVDDNVSFLDNVENLLRRHVAHIDQIALAHDGVEAVELLRNFHCDVILIDVRMPRMGGLDLAFHVREYYPSMKIVFISAYDQTNYLKQAIKLKASDYLLKPLDYEEFITVLNRIIDQIGQENEMQVQLSEVKDQKIVRTLLELLEFQNSSGRTLDIHSPFYLLRIQGLTDASIFQSLRKINRWVVPINHEALYLAIADPGSFAKTVTEACDLVSELRNNGNPMTYGCLSDVITEPSDVYAAGQLLRQLVDVFYFRPEQGLVTPGDLDNCRSIESVSETAALIFSDLEKREYQAALSGLDLLYNQVRQNRIIEKPGILRLYYRMMTSLTRRPIQINNPAKILNEFDFVLFDRLLAMPSFFDLHQFLVNEIAVCLESEKTASSSSTIDFIRRFQQYVAKNYDQDLSVDSICKSLFISRSYLSAVVKNLTGETIVNYINRVRLENSIRLLGNPDLTIQDIAGKVGFTNCSYYIKLFKEFNHLTPQEYRHQISDQIL